MPRCASCGSTIRTASRNTLPRRPRAEPRQHRQSSAIPYFKTLRFALTTFTRASRGCGRNSTSPRAARSSNIRETVLYGSFATRLILSTLAGSSLAVAAAAALKTTASRSVVNPFARRVTRAWRRRSRGLSFKDGSKVFDACQIANEWAGRPRSNTETFRNEKSATTVARLLCPGFGRTSSPKIPACRARAHFEQLDYASATTNLR